MRNRRAVLGGRLGGALRAVERAPQDRSCDRGPTQGSKCCWLQADPRPGEVRPRTPSLQQALSVCRSGRRESNNTWRVRRRSRTLNSPSPGGGRIPAGLKRVGVLPRPGDVLIIKSAKPAVLGRPRLRQADIDAWVGEHRVWVVHGGDEAERFPLLAGEALALHAVGATLRA